MLSEPVRRDAATRARDSGEPTSTGRLSLIRRPGEYGVRVFVPVYRRGSDTDSEVTRRAAFLGLAAGVFRINDIVHAGSQPLRPRHSEIDIAILDLSGPAEEQVLYPASLAEHGKAALTAGPHVAMPLLFGLRHWMIIATPRALKTGVGDSFMSVLVLLGGLGL